MRAFVLFVPLLALGVPAAAQYPLVRTLQPMDGQQGLRTTCLAQDDQGLLWLGGDLGLFRTDGDRTEAILRTEGDEVLALCGMGHGVVAALASGYVISCDARGCDTLWSDTLFRTSPVRSLVCDPRMGIWAGTYGGGTRLWRQGRITRLTMSSGLNDDHVNAQCLVGEDRMVIATDLGMSITDLDGRVLGVFGEEQGAPDNLVLAVAATSDGAVWAGSDRGGVFRFDPNRPERGAEILDTSWSEGPVTHITTTADRLWMGIQGRGTMIVDLSQGRAYYRPLNTQQGANSQVSALLRDRDGAVWWCDGTPVVRRGDPAVLIVPAHEGVDMHRITAIARRGDHHIAFALGNRVYTHANTFTVDEAFRRAVLPVDSTTQVVSLQMDGSIGLWAGTFGKGVFRMDANDAPQAFHGAPVHLNANVLSVRARADTTWFATLNGVYASARGPEGHLVTWKPTIPGSGFTFDVLPARDGSVLVATDGNGIIRILPDGSSLSLPGAHKDHRTFYSLCSDDRGRVWTCGPGTGVYRVDQDRLTPVGSEAGVVMNEVYSFAFFGGRLFLFGDGGAFSLDPEGGRAVELTGMLGLRGAQAELNASVVDAQGQLWMASDLGLFRINSDLIERSDRAIAVITGIRQGGEVLGVGSPIELPADRDFITFRFTGIHYEAPEDLHFAYRLIGADTVLRTTRDRELTFSHLAPGDYRFELFAYVGPRPVGATPATYSFSIAAPWWRSWWAISLGSLLLLVALYAALRIRDSRLRARDRMEKAEARMEQERVSFQMKVIRSQVNPHFLFNSFNTLIDLIEEAPDKAVKHVEQLSDFFREILQVRDKELIPLEEELRLVDTYFFLEQRRFGDRIALRTRVSRSALEAMVPPLTVQLLVENALKHNRATEAEPLVITITTTPGELVVSNPYQPRDRSDRSTGFGIDSIRQRFAAITPRPVTIGREHGEFVARIPLLEQKP